MKQIKSKCSGNEWFFLLILLFCLIFLPGLLQARELSESEVRSAVQTWVRYVTADARPDAIIERMEPYQVEGKTVAYIVHLSGGGFCLCGADDLVAPVYFYSPRRTYDPKIPDYQDILWEIQSRFKYLHEGLRKSTPEVLKYQNALSQRVSYWQELIAGRIPRRIELKAPLAAPDSMSLRLTSRWHQNEPYNDSCPELTPGQNEHTIVGCVATAMSQIMYYWKWPNTGMGVDTTIYWYRWRNNWDEEPLADDPGIPSEDCWIGRLEWTAWGGGRLRMNGYWDVRLWMYAQRIDTASNYLNALNSLWNRLTHQDTTICAANFGATNYNWSILQDIHEDPPDDGDAEVAKLCYHAGISVRMGYGIIWSGVGTPCVDTAFEDHFRYDPDACYHPDVNQSVMVEEIQWLRPLEPTGTGHAWVVFGYNTNTEPWQFKMNLGYGGKYDDWWTCDSIGDEGQFILVQHFDHIAPENVVRFVGGGVPGDGSPADPYADIEEAIVEAQNGATLIFKAGSVNGFDAAALVIDRPFTLKGRNAVIK